MQATYSPSSLRTSSVGDLLCVRIAAARSLVTKTITG